MTKDNTLKSPSRRAFFRKAGAAAGVAGAVALGGGSGSAAESPKGAPKAGSYRETEHVKTAYRLARF